MGELGGGVGSAWWVGGAGQHQSVISNKPGELELGRSKTHTHARAHRPYADVTVQLWHSC